MTDAFTTRLSNTLREKLEAEAHDVGARLTGVVVAEYADYREQVGLAKGLRRAVALLSEIEKAMSHAEEIEKAATPHKRYED